MSEQNSNNTSANNKRIAKNTLMLYFRMILTMLVSLYTSRIVLATLGVEDYGIYNVVGGFVAMFSIISSSLSGAIGRFTNFEMGRGNKDKLHTVFCTSLNVQFIICAIVFVLAETIGLWFLYNKMVIPAERMEAAEWVFHCSIVAFMVNLISVPYNASIIAHERMKAFAYIGIVEVVLKLLIVYLLVISPIDKLKLYAILLLCISLAIRYIYGRYCLKNFEECRYSPMLDRSLFKEMFSYSGWTFIGTSSALFMNQGVNILLNMFFGPAVNAARGIANQVNNAINSFVVNFTTALNPQIVQSYASGNFEFCLNLVYRGSKFSYYILLILALPVLFDADFILTLWLKEVPEHTLLFVRLILVYSMLRCISNPLIRLVSSTGNIRNYQLVVGGLQMLNLPIDYVLLKYFDMPAEGTVVVLIIVEFAEMLARMYMITKIAPFHPYDFMRRVLCKIIIVTLLATIIPAVLYLFIEGDLLRFFLIGFSSIICSILTIIVVGLSKGERQTVLSSIKKIIKKS